jgi:hypothetical protein
MPPAIIFYLNKQLRWQLDFFLSFLQQLQLSFTIYLVKNTIAKTTIATIIKF